MSDIANLIEQMEHIHKSITAIQVMLVVMTFVIINKIGKSK